MIRLLSLTDLSDVLGHGLKDSTVPSASIAWDTNSHIIEDLSVAGRLPQTTMPGEQDQTKGRKCISFRITFLLCLESANYGTLTERKPLFNWSKEGWRKWLT